MGKILIAILINLTANNKHLWIPLKWTLNPVDDLEHDIVIYQHVPVSYWSHLPQTSCIGQVVRGAFDIKFLKGSTFTYQAS